MNANKVETLFLDIGNVLLTNGWDRGSRKLAAAHFNFDMAEMDERHHLTFDTYELGKLSLDDYLKRAVFYTDRDFTKEEFKTFMYEQSQPYEEMISFFKSLKAKYHFNVVALNNEGRELNDFRIKKFRLDKLFDSFASSCYVKLRKPDIDIFHIALDIAHTTPSRSIYVDDRLLYIEVASAIGIHTVHHQTLDNTKEKLKEFGFSL